ncbi:MAG: hypothetical protein ACOCZE_04670 [Planctomycetota bacterium]
MNRSAKIRSFYAAAALAALLSVGAVTAAVAWPIGLEPTRPGRPARPAGQAQRQEPSQTDEAEKLDPDQLARLTQVDLRRPLYDDQVTQTPRSAAPRAQLTVRLIGIAVEPGHSVAMLIDPAGKILLAQAGETVEIPGGPMKVIAVLDDSIRVEFQGRIQALPLPEPDQTGAGR